MVRLNYTAYNEAVLRERGYMSARTFVRICKCISRPSFCEPPPSQSRRHVMCYVRTTLHHDTLWRTHNLTLQKTGMQKTDRES